MPSSRRRDFDRKIRVVPGMAVEYAARDSKTKETPNPKYIKNVNNRTYVVDKILKYVKEQKTIDEAINLIMQEDIIDEFKYFTDNGVDLRKVFYNWSFKRVERIQKQKGNNDLEK